MRQPLLTVAVLKPGLIYLMLRVLYLPQFVQEDFQLGVRNSNPFDVMVHRVVVFTNILSDDQFSSAGSSRQGTPQSGAPHE